MMKRLSTLAACMLALVAVVPPAQAQPNPVQGFLEIALIPDATYLLVSPGATGPGPNGRTLTNEARFRFLVQDLSYDPYAGGSAAPVYHTLTFNITKVDPNLDDGWGLISQAFDTAVLQSGQTVEETVIVQRDVSAVGLVAEIRVQATLRHSNPGANGYASVTREMILLVRVAPSPAIDLFALADRPWPLNAKPDETVTIPFVVVNADNYLQKIDISMKVQDAEDIDASKLVKTGDGGYIFGPKEQRYFNLTLRMPKETTWYRSILLQYTVTAANSENPSVFFARPGVITIDGFYFGKPLLSIIPLLLLVVAVLIFLLLRSRRYYEEQVLGKPIAPWRIPQERARLVEMRKQDPRSFYLTRHFLMVEEYGSALNWFDAFKRREKRAIGASAAAARLASKAESLEEPPQHRFDRRAVRLKKKFEHKRERERLRLEAELERLKDKLDQHFEEDFEKDHEKWEEKVAKLEKKADKPWFRAHRKWEAERKKALAKWEKPFLKEKTKADKAIEKAKDSYAHVVKKKDKEVWKDWREACEIQEADNKVRAKEGKEPLPMPDLVSKVVDPPEYPPTFQPPPKPRLPAEPVRPKLKDLPPEPQLVKPELDASHYAKKAARMRRKSAREERSLEKKLARALAKNERKRLRYLAKADRRRGILLRKAVVRTEAPLLARLFRITPESSEQRTQRKMLKALAKDQKREIDGSAENQIEVLRTKLRREEAELVARLALDRTVATREGRAVDTEGERSAIEAMEAEHAAKLATEREAILGRAAAAKAAVDVRLITDVDALAGGKSAGDASVTSKRTSKSP